MILSKVIAGAALALALSFAAYADFTGKVVAVADGDTITILDAGNKQHRIRINGIDAPEKAQPFGDRSRQNMGSMVTGREVTADCHKTDRYGRQVCKVWVQPADCSTCGKTLDVGRHLYLIVCTSCRISPPGSQIRSIFIVTSLWPDAEGIREFPEPVSPSIAAYIPDMWQSCGLWPSF